MRVIFLDIDGVLVNRRSLRERSGMRAIGDPECVAALNYILATTDAAIVLSSSWRFCGLEEIRLILRHWCVVGSLVGMTPDLTRREPSGLYVGSTRGAEIQQWLDENTEPIESFVILDDDCDMGALAPRLVKTEFEIGLTMVDAQRAIELLTSLARRTETACDKAHPKQSGK